MRAGSRRCLLTGYGGFNISLTPSFDSVGLPVARRGRRRWRWRTFAAAASTATPGTAPACANASSSVFDDFIAAAEWLQSTGRAARGPRRDRRRQQRRPARRRVPGAASGSVRRRRLPRAGRRHAALSPLHRRPLLDPRVRLRRRWPPTFAFLLRYSPYHNVIDGTAYPPTLVMTADTDDRVAPGMAKKFAARLQEAVGGHRRRADSAARRDARRPRRRQADRKADRRAG